MIGHMGTYPGLCMYYMLTCTWLAIICSYQDHVYTQICVKNTHMIYWYMIISLFSHMNMSMPHNHNHNIVYGLPVWLGRGRADGKFRDIHNVRTLFVYNKKAQTINKHTEHEPTPVCIHHGNNLTKVNVSQQWPKTCCPDDINAASAHGVTKINNNNKWSTPISGGGISIKQQTSKRKTHCI